MVRSSWILRSGGFDVPKTQEGSQFPPYRVVGTREPRFPSNWEPAGNLLGTLGTPRLGTFGNLG